MFKKTNNKKTKKVLNEHRENKPPRKIEQIKNKLFTKKTKPTKPTKEELSDVELALQKLWELDKNRLNPKVDVCNYVKA